MCVVGLVAFLQVEACRRTLARGSRLKFVERERARGSTGCYRMSIPAMVLPPTTVALRWPLYLPMAGSLGDV